MKKLLSILLSLILVVCMVPATASLAFAGSGNGTVTVVQGEDSQTYGVTVSETVYTYDGQVKRPSVTLAAGAPSYTVSYRLQGSESISELRDAGTYEILITTTAESQTFVVTGCTIEIEKADPSRITIEQISNKELISDSAEIVSNPGSYFEVYDGNLKLEAGVDVTMICTYDSTNDAYIVVATGTNKNYQGFNISGTFEVNTDISGYSAVVDEESITYTGSILTPSVTVKKNAESQPLTQGKDYTVASLTQTQAEKEDRIVIKGAGRYTGTIIMQSIKIKARNISEATAEEITVIPGQQPDLVLKYNGSTLVKGRDYDYPSVTTTGVTSVDVKVTGQGNFTGEKTVKVNVTSDAKNLAAATLTTRGTLTYNGSAQSPTFTVKVGTTTVDASYYTIKYKLNGSSSAASTTKPTNAGTYDVEIAAITSNRGGYTGSKTFTSAFKIEPLDINASSVSATYTGSPSYNPVKLQLGTKVLTWNTDYDVEFKSSSNYYIVTGKGNFKGTRNVYTSVRNLSYCTISFSDGRSSVSYGQTYYPKVTVTDYVNGKSTKLYENTDYELTYKNSKNQVVSYCRDTGTYSVIVTGKGAYTGTRTLNFTINGTDISNYTVTLKESSVKVTGTNQIPVISSVKYGAYSSLTSNDYTVSYQDSTGKTVTSMSLPGTYKVIVTGRNGYSGSTSTTFRIVGLTQTVTVDQESHKVYPTSTPFRIVAKATGDGTGFTYYSSNPAVASVSATGYVTMHKVGRAEITVMATGMKKYEPASATVEVKVYPKKTTISKKPWTDGKKGQLKVRWGYQDGVTKYQIRYSRDKNFSSGSYLTKTVKAHGKDYTTQSTTLSNLKSGYTYYIKVRAVYTDPATGDNYYGLWSGWRSAKTI